MKTKYFAVLITCYNRCEKTVACLDALYQCSLPDGFKFEIFLVDDGSTDGTEQQVSEYFPEVNIIRGTGSLFWNRGMHLAWNTAIKTKVYDFYLWLNDDTLLFHNALSIMLEYSEQLDNTNILIGSTCSRIDNQNTYGGFIFPFNRIKPNGNWQKCDFFNGNIVLVPKEVYNRVGNLDGYFRHFLGDVDYGLRAAKLRIYTFISPEYLGYCENHEHDPSWRNPTIPLVKRLMYLYTPLGNNPIEHFVFDTRHYGIIKALVHFFSIHLRTIAPSIWKNISTILML